MADNQQTIDNLISFIAEASEPESVTNIIVARILAHLNARTPAAFVFTAQDRWGTLTLSCNDAEVAVTIPGMDNGLAGLYTPTRHAQVMSAIAPAVVGLEVEPMDTFCRIWATTAGGSRINIAQIPGMDADKAGLFTPNRLASILAAISSAVSPVDTRLTAVEKLIQADSDGAINKFNEIVRFLAGIRDTATLDGIIEGISAQISENRDDIATLFQTEKTVAQHSRELTDLSDEIQTVATRENDRWATPAFITLADRVSGVTVETSSTFNPTATSDYVYDTATGNILLRQTPAVISAANPVRYYLTWAGRDSLDILSAPGGIGYFPAQSTALRPYPGRLYVFSGTTGIWCAGTDGKLRKIADVCSCSADKDKG